MIFCEQQLPPRKNVSNNSALLKRLFLRFTVAHLHMNILVVVTEGFPEYRQAAHMLRSFVHGEAETDIAPIVQVKTADINFGNLNPVNEGPFIINDICFYVHSKFCRLQI